MNDDVTNGEAKRSPHDGLLKGTLGASTVITAWVFVLGWTYLHTYYAYFGINVSSLDFPIYHYPLFLFTQFVSFQWHGAFLGVLILVMFCLAWFGGTVRRPIPALLIGVLILGLFWCGFYVAETNATRVAEEDIGLNSTLPAISFEFEKPQEFRNGDLEVILGAANLRLVIEDKDRFFVFVPVDLARQPKSAIYVNVVSVNRSEVFATMRTTRIK